MRLIRPYGKTQVASENGKLERKIVPKSGDNLTAQSFPDFARQPNRLLLAQWISVVDKILSKPIKPPKDKAETKQNQQLKDCRLKLGKACWKILKQKLVAQYADSTVCAELEAIWNSKINACREEEKSVDKGKSTGEGRWYKTFVPDGQSVGKLDCSQLAQMIERHLHVAARRFRHDQSVAGDRKSGLIAWRAQSVAQNVRKLHAASEPPDERAALWEQYLANGKIIADIQTATKDKKGKQRLSLAMQELQKHYAGLESSAGQHSAALLDLHREVTACYRQLLSTGHKQLPGTPGELRSLVASKRRNKEISQLLYRGKLIHYTRSNPENWPAEADLENSNYRGSDGQTKIKQTEAFIRIWRYSVSLAARSLQQWVDPRHQLSQDVLTLDDDKLDRITQNIDMSHHQNFLRMVFGACQETLQPADARALQQFALRSLTRIRNASFHFKSLRDFLEGLQQKDKNSPSKVTQLLQKDWASRPQQLTSVLEGIQATQFCTTAQLQAWWPTAILQACGADLPLPRLSKLLQRNADAKVASLPPLPKDRQTAAWQCHYTLLKLAYDRGFRGWLCACPSGVINAWIRKACDRANEAARTINSKKIAGYEKSLIVSRAYQIGLSEVSNVRDFVSRLMAETASEMRVQRDYTHNAEQAAKQARYIQNLLMDVVALAFCKYLDEQKLAFLKPDWPEQPGKPAADLSSLPTLPHAQDGSQAFGSWESCLYFLLHLIPVDDVSRLLHQLRRWCVGAEASQEALAEEALDEKVLDAAGKVITLMTLYLNQHDVHHAGNAGWADPDQKFKLCYADANVYQTLFQQPHGDAADALIPRRGLRELLRFGTEKALMPIWTSAEHQVTQDQFRIYQEGQGNPGQGNESPIAKWQRERVDLHKLWVKKQMQPEERKRYAALVEDIGKYRRAVAHMTLHNHLRLYRLCMAVVARLLDYSGLWERDLYFVTLAEISLSGETPESIWPTPKDRKNFYNGQIVKAINSIDKKDDSLATRIKERMAGSAKQFDAMKKIRNDLAHFNFLRYGNPPQLTTLVNRVRELMSYDRKLKNAVSKSIRELLQREGLDLQWSMCQGHTLKFGKLETGHAVHLADKVKGEPIREPLHGEEYVQMVKKLFEK